MNVRRWLLALIVTAAIPLHAAPTDQSAPSSSSQSSSEPSSATDIAAGSIVQRSLTDSETHRYRLAVHAGEVATITVEQQGVDVIVSTLTADGAQIGDHDTESRPRGDEHATIVSDTDATYVVTVKATYPHHSTADYRLTVEEVRPASATDRAIFDAHRLGSEAARLRTAGQYDRALDTVRQALTLASPVLKANDAYIGTLTLTEAQLLRTKGDSAAEATFLRAIAINEAALGRRAAPTAYAIDALGSFYTTREEYAKAEALLTESIDILEHTAGAEHPRVAVALMDISRLYGEREDHDRAISVLTRAIAIGERTLDADDFTLAALRNNLGDVYISMNDYDRAEPYLTQALASIEKIYGPRHPRVTNPLDLLSIIARKRGEYDRAIAMLERSYAIREAALGANNMQAMEPLISLGNVYAAKGDYPKALELFARARTVLEATAGPYHRLTLLTIANAARTYAAQGDLAHAIEFQTRSDTIVEKHLALNIAVGSERQKLAYFDSIFERTGRTVSLNVRQLPESDAATNLAALTLLQRKGRVQDAMANTLMALRSRLDTSDQALLDALGQTTTKLANLALAGPGKLPFAEYQSRVDALGAERESLEARVNDHSAAFRAQSRPVTLASVMSAVPDGSALVEIGVYRPFDPKGRNDAESYGPDRYVAYVIRPHAAISWVDLGAIADVDRDVNMLRDALRDPARSDVKTLARTLDARVMQPVRARLGDATHLIISPDGALNLIPFEALVDEQQRYLVERYTITYLTSGRDLLRLQVPRSSRSEPLVVADPQFGEPPASSPAHAVSLSARRTASDRRSVTTSGDRSTVYFAPIVGTAYEARAIKQLFPDAHVLTGTQATKQALSQANAPAILHIATHGFFLRDGGNPLLRSGLALSGANLASAPGADAGVLTALEAANLNLWGTELVTLSACDTGLGEVRNGEGVYGLRRAFFLAGAETVVMSLWPVSDRVTRETMVTYYRGLKDGLGRGDALHRAQLTQLKRPNRQHPFYWASFIQSGEWGALDAK